MEWRVRTSYNTFVFSFSKSDGNLKKVVHLCINQFLGCTACKCHLVLEQINIRTPDFLMFILHTLTDIYVGIIGLYTSKLLQGTYSYFFYEIVSSFFFFSYGQTDANKGISPLGWELC